MGGRGWPQDAGLFDNWAVDGLDATQACCGCGGGSTRQESMSSDEVEETAEQSTEWLENVSAAERESLRDVLGTEVYDGNCTNHIVNILTAKDSKGSMWWLD